MMAKDYLIKDVIVAFCFGLEDESRAFQEVCSNLGAYDVGPVVKLDFNVFSEPRAVVISCRFGVPKGFHDRVRCYHRHSKM
jgi:hypothetical protein